MHEMSLAQGILQVVLDAAEDEKILRVRLQVGRLQMVTPDALEFSFRLLAAGTRADEAIIDVQETPAMLRCGQCGSEIELGLPQSNCPSCGASDIEVLAGHEIIVDAIELESGETIGRRVVPYVEPVGHSNAQAMSESGRYV